MFREFTDIDEGFATLTIGAITEQVAAAFDVKPSDINSHDRHKTVAEARALVCWIARRLTRLSYPQIGAALGGRDHTTIMHALKATDRRIAKDRWFAATTSRLLARLGATEIRPLAKTGIELDLGEVAEG